MAQSCPGSKHNANYVKCPLARVRGFPATLHNCACVMFSPPRYVPPSPRARRTRCPSASRPTTAALPPHCRRVAAVAASCVRFASAGVRPSSVRLRRPRPRLKPTGMRLSCSCMLENVNSAPVKYNGSSFDNSLLSVLYPRTRTKMPVCGIYLRRTSSVFSPPACRVAIFVHFKIFQIFYELKCFGN